MAGATGWASRVAVAVGWATAVAGWEAAAVETADLEEEDGEAEDGGRTEVARAELEQKQRRRKLRAGMEWPVRARGLAWQGWHGLGLPPIGIAGLARARELGTAGLGGPGHAYLPRLAAELGEHVRGQQESRGAGWRLGRRVTQERLGEWLHAKCGGADRRRDETQLEKLGARGVRASLRAGGWNEVQRRLFRSPCGVKFVEGC